jgi:hypothetical protein
MSGLSRSRSALPTGAVLVGPHLPAVPRTKNGRQGGLEPEFMPAGVPPPARLRAGAETEARPLHELLAPPRRLIRGGPRQAAIGIGPLDEKRMHL